MSNGIDNDFFDFTIVDGAVVAFFEIKDDEPRQERIRPNQSFAFVGDDIEERERENGYTTIRTYSPNDDGTWSQVTERYIAADGSELPDDPEDDGDVDAEDLAGGVDVEEGRFGQWLDAGIRGQDEAQVLGLVVPARFGVG